MDLSKTKICPSCRTEYSVEDNIRFCTKCGSPLSGAASEPINSAARCVSCGANLNSEHKFCPACGVKVGVTTSNEAISNINNYNEELRKKKEKSKMTVISAVIAICAVIIALAVVFTYSIIYMYNSDTEYVEDETITDEYYELVYDFYDDVYEASYDLSYISDTYVEYCYDANFKGQYDYSVESAVLAAKIYLSDEIREINLDKEEIYDKYLKIMGYGDDLDYDTSTIKEAVSNTYKKYDEYVNFIAEPGDVYTEILINNTSKPRDLDEQLSILYELLYY